MRLTSLPAVTAVAVLLKDQRILEQKENLVGRQECCIRFRTSSPRTGYCPVSEERHQEEKEGRLVNL